jgi:hypothetical protein
MYIPGLQRKRTPKRLPRSLTVEERRALLARSLALGNEKRLRARGPNGRRESGCGAFASSIVPRLVV